MSARLAAGLLLLMPAAGAQGARAPLNVVIIAVDGLRADHLPLYGYPLSTAPRLSARAASAVVFDRAVAQASWTLPSFASLFTSRYPDEHNANSQFSALALSERLLAQVLRERGWRTAAFLGGPFIDPVYGFQRGFDLFRGCGQGNYRFLDETGAQAAEWIRAHPDKPFFVFVHGNDVHPPFDLTHQGEHRTHAFDADYRGPVDSMLIDYVFVGLFNTLNASRAQKKAQKIMAAGDYAARLKEIRDSPRDIRHIVAHYDGRILEADAAIDRLFEALRKSGHDRDTIVVLLGDHGLEWGEKGVLGTGWHASQYDTITHVPLVVWAPGLGPRRIATPVELVDVAPTLLDLLGLPPEPAFHGKSLAGLAEGRPPGPGPHYAYSTSSVTDAQDNSIRMYSVQDERWKLIYEVKRESRRLFDLRADPAENSDVASSHPEVVARLRRALAARIKPPHQ